MGIDVGGGGESGVAQPVLNLLHGDTLTEKERCTRMPQVVETYGTQGIPLQKQSEMVRDVVRAKELPHLVHTDIIQVIGAVGSLEQSAVILLLSLLFEKQLPHSRDQRQSAEAGLGFQLVFRDYFMFTVHHVFGNLVVDRNRPSLKVYRAPTDTQHLTAAQAVVGSQLDHSGYWIVAGSFK